MIVGSNRPSWSITLNQDQDTAHSSYLDREREEEDEEDNGENNDEEEEEEEKEKAESKAFLLEGFALSRSLSSATGRAWGGIDLVIHIGYVMHYVCVVCAVLY